MCDMQLQLQKCETVKDLGVIINSNLAFEDHITEKVNKAYSVLGLIQRNFEHIGKDAFVLLNKSTVRSHRRYDRDIQDSRRKI